MGKEFLEGRLVRVEQLSRKGTFRIELENGEGRYLLYRRGWGEDNERERLFQTAIESHNQRVSVRYDKANLDWADNLLDYVFQALTLRFKPYRDIPTEFKEIIEINPVLICSPSNETVDI